MYTLNFLIQFLFISRYLFFLYYKGILAFIFEHIMVQEIFFTIFLSLLKYTCLHCLPTTSPHPTHPTSHPQSYPLWLCACVLHTCSLMALLLFSPIIPVPPPLWLLFFISMSLVLFFLLVCFVD